MISVSKAQDAPHSFMVLSAGGHLVPGAEVEASVANMLILLVAGGEDQRRKVYTAFE